MDKNKHKLATLAISLITLMFFSSLVIAGPFAPKQCNDGVDNDLDGTIDYPDDPGCSSKRDNNERGTIQCDDGIDNDGDTRTDYPNDSGCTSPGDTSELSPTIQCDDGVDNGDADSLKDYPNDLGCLSPSDTNEIDGACDDLIDNDADTRIDFPNDQGCTSFSDASEKGVTQCDDGIDNDGDTKIDYPADTGCTDPSDNDESNIVLVQCNDGLDNDGDSKIDYPADPGCLSFSDNSEVDPASCTDTDFGYNIYTQGTVTYSNSSDSFSFTDFCADSVNLIEYYCGGATPISSNVNCAFNSTNACINGACTLS